MKAMPQLQYITSRTTAGQLYINTQKTSFPIYTQCPENCTYMCTENPKIHNIKFGML